MPCYIKAYPLSKLRAFENWREKSSAENVDPDNDIVFLHQDFFVTRNSLRSQDDDIIFDDISDAWVAFCRHELDFVVPDWAKEPTPED